MNGIKKGMSIPEVVPRLGHNMVFYLWGAGLNLSLYLRANNNYVLTNEDTMERTEMSRDMAIDMINAMNTSVLKCKLIVYVGCDR